MHTYLILWFALWNRVLWWKDPMRSLYPMAWICIEMLAEERIDCRCKHGEIGHLVYDSWAYGQSAMIEKFNQTKQDELMQGCDENEILYENKYSSVA